MDNKECAIRVRNLLTERSESGVNITLPHIQALIVTALEEWTRSCFADREKRELFKTRFNAEIADGRLDLTPYIDGTTARINLKELRETPIYSGEAIYTLYRTISTVAKGATATDVTVSQSGDITSADIGNRVVITSSAGVVLGTTTVATVTDPDFTITDGILDYYTGATAKLYKTDACEYQAGSSYTWLNSLQQLIHSRPVGADSAAIFLEGVFLRTRTAAGRFDGVDHIVFTVTNYPANVGEISKDLEQDFVLYLAGLAVREIGQSANG